MNLDDIERLGMTPCRSCGKWTDGAYCDEECRRAEPDTDEEPDDETALALASKAACVAAHQAAIRNLGHSKIGVIVIVVDPTGDPGNTSHAQGTMPIPIGMFYIAETLASMLAKNVESTQ